MRPTNAMPSTAMATTTSSSVNPAPPPILWPFPLLDPATQRQRRNRPSVLRVHITLDRPGFTRKRRNDDGVEPAVAAAEMNDGGVRVSLRVEMREHLARRDHPRRGQGHVDE